MCGGSQRASGPGAEWESQVRGCRQVHALSAIIVGKFSHGEWRRSLDIAKCEVWSWDLVALKPQSPWPNPSCRTPVAGGSIGRLLVAWPPRPVLVLDTLCILVIVAYGATPDVEFELTYTIALPTHGTRTEA